MKYRVSLIAFCLIIGTTNTFSQVGIGTTSPVTELQIYSPNESTTLTNFTQALGNGGLLIQTDYTANAYTPGVFWSTTVDNPTLPKAGIFLRETGSGTFMHFGTSAAYATGITSSNVVISPVGRVGIGVSSPLTLLSVKGQGNTKWLGIERSSSTTEQMTFINAEGTAYSAATGTSSGTWTNVIDNNNSNLMLSTNNGSGTGGKIFLDAENVGIATTSPTAKFHVNHNAQTTQAFYVDAGDMATTQTLFEHTGLSTPVPFRIEKSGFGGTSASFGILRLHLDNQNAGSGSNLYFTLDDNTGAETEYGGLGAIISDATDGSEDGALAFYTIAGGLTRQERMRIISTGNVGIGTASPAEKLHVVGSIRMNDGAETAGDIMVSDANGVASWATPASLGLGGDGIYGGDGTAPADVDVTVTDDIDFDGGTFFIDGTNDRIGIGTDSPSNKLHISGSDPIFRIDNSDANNASNTVAQDIRMNTTATSRIYFRTLVTSTGVTDATRTSRVDFFTNDNGAFASALTLEGQDVGIGTTAPYTRLHVLGGDIRGEQATASSGTVTGAGELDLYLDDDSETAEEGMAITFRSDFNGGAGASVRAAIRGGTESTGNTGVGFLSFYTNAAPANSASEKMRITSSGNVGIGTSSPTERLDVYPDSDVSSQIGRAHLGYVGWADYAGFSHVDQNGTGSYALLQHSSGITYLNAANAQSIYFRINNLDEMRLTTTGLGIGTTSPAEELHVVGSIRMNDGAETAGDIITSDANGVASWVTPSSLGLGDGIYGGNGTTPSNVDVTVTDNIDFDGGTLFIDGTNNRVGVGTSSPTSKFHVNHNGQTTQAFYVDAGNMATTQTLFEHSGVATPVPFRIVKSGFGGTSAPFGILRLHLDNQNVGSGSNLHFTLNDATGAETEYGGLGAIISDATDGSEDGALAFYTTAGGTLRQERVRINSIGNVGIGTPSPTERLDVYPGTDISSQIGQAHVGNVGFADYAGFSHVDRNSTTDYALLQHSTGETYLNAPTGENIWFRINNSTHMILNSAGDIGIGTAAPTEKLDVRGNTVIGDGLAFGDARISISGTNGNNDAAFVAARKDGTTDPVLAIMPWISQVYISSGIYYDDGVWTHHSDDGNNQIFTLDPGGGARWYASNNSMGSWNVASDEQLWDDAGNWKNLVQSTQAGDSYFTGGNLGVGIASPQSELSVKGQGNSPWLGVERSSSTTEQMKFVNAEGSGYTTARGTASGTWTNVIDNNNSDLMLSTDNSSGSGGDIILDADNVGISYTTPAVRLDIDQGNDNQGIRLRGSTETTEIADIYAGSGGRLIMDVTAGTGAAFFDMRGESPDHGIILRESDGTGTSAYANLFVTENGGNDYLSINMSNITNTTALNITEQNLVGIGTASPAAKLDVYGGGATGFIIRGSDINNHVGNFTIGGNGQFIFDNTTGTATQKYVEFRPECTTHGVVHAAGAGGGSAYANYFVVDAAEDYLSINVTNNTTTSAFNITSTNEVGIGTANPGGQFELSLDQGRKPGTNTWTVVSDERLKNITGNYSKGLAELEQLTAVTYKYKNVGDRTFDKRILDKEFVGFTAQNVKTVFPEAVGTDEDGYLNLNTHAIMVAYLNAIKELKQENESQKKDIIAQKQDIEELKRLVKQLSANK